MEDSLKCIKIFLELKIERELEIESAKQVLFSITNLDLRHLFNLINKNRSNSIKSSDLLSFLRYYK